MQKKAVHLNLCQLQTTGAGYDVLRHIALPDLLGKDAKSILYIMGKNLARTYSLKTMDDVTDFFEKMGWGQLQLTKEKRNEFIFELTGQPVAQREEAELVQEYRLEAGFLAEAVQQIKDFPCECLDERKARKKIVQFNVVYSK